MSTLEELNEKKNAIRLELIEVEKEIGRHPDTIRASFAHNPEWDMDAFEAIVEKITFIRPIRGKYDHDGEWRGFMYQMNDKVYRVRLGSSMVVDDDWMECGPANEEERMPLSFAESLWEEEDPVTALREKRQVTEDWKMAGYLLTLSFYTEDGESVV